MRLISAILTSALTFFTLSCSSAPQGSPQEWNQELRTLAAQSQKTKPECDHFAAKVSALLGSTPQDLPFKSRKDADRLAKLIATYPGTSEAFHQGSELLIQIAQRHALDFNAWAGLYPCTTITYLDGSRKLIASLGVLKPESKNTASQVLIEQNRNELSKTTTLINTMVNIFLLRTLIENGVLPSSKESAEEIKALEEEAAGFRKEIQAKLSVVLPRQKPGTPAPELSEEQAKEYQDVLVKEIRGSKKLSLKALNLLNRLSPQPTPSPTP